MWRLTDEAKRPNLQPQRRTKTRKMYQEKENQVVQVGSDLSEGLGGIRADRRIIA